MFQFSLLINLLLINCLYYKMPVTIPRAQEDNFKRACVVTYNIIHFQSKGQIKAAHRHIIEFSTGVIEKQVSYSGVVL